MTASGTVPARTGRSKDRRAQLAAIAAELFSERGYHSVGLADIASVAGITGPAIYRHFRNKHAILACAAQEFATVLDDCAQAAANAEGTGEQRLSAAVAAVVTLVVRRRGYVRLYQWEGRHLEPDERSQLRRRIRQLVDTMTALLAEVRPELSDRISRLLATAALSGIASLSTHRTTVATRTAEHALRATAMAALHTELAGSPGPAGSASSAQDVPATGRPLDSRRELLLASAVRLFRAQGYHEVSMVRIGQAAGINASSVYRHFAGKADLLAAVYYRAAERLAMATQDALESATDPADAVDRVVAAYVRLAFEHRDLIAVYLSEYENLPAADRQVLRRSQREAVAQWVRLVTALDGAGPAVVTRLRVHAALNIANDLATTNGRLASPEETAVIMRSVLHPGREWQTPF